MKPFISKATGSGELAGREGERGQLSPRPLLGAVSQTVAALCGLRKRRRESRAGATPVHPTEDLTQGYLNDLNCVFLHCVDYLTKGDKKSVFSLSKRKYKVSQGVLLLSISTLGGKHSGVIKKKKKLFESKGNAMLACEQMGIDYPCVIFRPKIKRKFPTVTAGWTWNSLPVTAEDKSAQLISTCLSTM